ncbi:hypothetical protein GEV33_006013 [Tenebrio molitor]|uniref:Integrase catalytic domain-containing protein n=1 Tax=Tenebrio molitor TaxID=7067 RepID=A0A8J6HM38_TENMO|nr:hypothetical protein GEV33_006013 [Tenebrio molitor]
MTQRLPVPGTSSKSDTPKNVDFAENEMELCIINDLLAILLLYSIPDEYESFRIAIETQEKLPQLEALKIKLLEEYEARKQNLKRNVLDAIFINKNPEVVTKVYVEHDKRWCLDSGASSHTCSEKAKFKEIKNPKVQTLNLANSCSTKIVGSGTVRLNVEENLTVRLDETLYVPDLRSNFLSVAKMTEHGFEVIFRRNETIVRNPDTEESVIVARRDKDMYYIDELSEVSRMSQISTSLQEWHERFGHLNETDLKNIIRKQKVDAIDVKADEALPVCETCVKSKQTRKPFTRSVSQCTELLEPVHTHVCGLMRVNSLAEYTPQQNGVAERKNRSMIARCLMIQSGLSASLWAEAILTANYLRDRCPSRSLRETRTVIRNRDVTFTGRNQTENNFTNFINEEIFKKCAENVIEFNVPEAQKEDKQAEICDLEEDGETLVEEENGEEIPGETAKTVKEHEAEIEEEQNHENEEFHDVTGLIEFADPQTVSKAGKKTVDSKWVLRTKLKNDGSVDLPRLVAKGFTQKPGIDFNETFAPVAKLGSIRLFMAIAVELGIQIHQLDFTSAYLNGEIDEEVFLEIPSEFHDILNEEESRKFRGSKVCLIRKAFYGLKQSGRQWCKKLDEKLKQQKLKPLDSNPCVYINKEDGNIVIVVIYVDDLMVASDNPRKLKRCNPNEKLSKEMCPKTEEEKTAVEKLTYQSLVGSLMYLVVSTRPDIAYAVSMLSQFNTNFGEEHFNTGVLRNEFLLRYLKNTENLSLMFKKSGQELVGYTDADWSASMNDRRSYTGSIFNFANAAVSWELRKQRTVAMSSTEAEYMALSESTKEAIPVRGPRSAVNDDNF